MITMDLIIFITRSAYRMGSARTLANFGGEKMCTDAIIGNLRACMHSFKYFLTKRARFYIFPLCTVHFIKKPALCAVGCFKSISTMLHYEMFHISFNKTCSVVNFKSLSEDLHSALFQISFAKLSTCTV